MLIRTEGIIAAAGVPPFISQWKTDNAGGVSGDDQIQLPLISSGAYNFLVDWGDGTTNYITVYNQAETLHTYSTAGTYTVTIYGLCNGIRFNNGGDLTKIINITAWGNMRLRDAAFRGCANLVSVVTTAPPYFGTTTIYRLFAGSGLATFNSPNWNLSASGVTSMSTLFYSNQATTLDISTWNTTGVITFENMLAFGGNYTSINVTGLNTASATTFASMFYGMNLNPLNVTGVDGFNIGNLTTAENMFGGSTLSTAAYSAILNAWAAQSPSIQSSVPFHAGNSKYNSGAVAARGVLTGTHGWTITDGGAE